MKTIATLVILFISTSVLADGQYACVSSDAAGLNWEDGSWKVSKFKDVNSLLSIKGSGSKVEYKAADSNSPDTLNCTLTDLDFLKCSSDMTALNIVFNEKSLRGGVSGLLGSLSGNPKYKDSLYVMPITCQKF
jgi:hypothetical protein